MLADQQQVSQENKDKDYDSQVAFAIIGAGLANVIALLQINGPLTLWNTMAGIIILCILQAYPPAPSSRFFLNLAYAATWSISFLATIGVVFNMIFSLFGGSFPDTNSKFFTPFPVYHSNTFTPFNAYDVSFFLVWLAIFLIYFIFFSRRRNKNRIKSTSSKEQPKPGPETPRAIENGTSTTPATPEHPSDTP